MILGTGRLPGPRMVNADMDKDDGVTNGYRLSVMPTPLRTNTIPIIRLPIVCLPFKTHAYCICF